MAEENERLAVTFIRSGLQVGGQVHVAGTWAALPVALANLSATEQVAEYGAAYFTLGIADGAIPASESYLLPEPERSESPLLTVEEVAALLRVTEEHVRNMVRRGLLEAVRLGDGRKARMRFRRSALTRWLGPHGPAALGHAPAPSQNSYFATGAAPDRGQESLAPFPARGA